MSKRLFAIITLGAIAGLIVSLGNPVHSGVTKLGFLVSLLVCLLGVAFILWKFRLMRLIMICGLLALTVTAFITSAPIDSVKLHQSYMMKLRSFEGAPYVWGGEASNGIDCSGLPRRALREALLDYAITQQNTSAFYQYLEQWWYDTSAQAMGEGYRGFTIALEPEGSIAELDHSGLKAGDLAVTKSGLHVLVYLGNEEWIQADPGAGKVIINHAKTSDNIWLDSPITSHRWSLFAKE